MGSAHCSDGPRLSPPAARFRAAMESCGDPRGAPAPADLPGSGCGVMFWICRSLRPGPPVLRRASAAAKKDGGNRRGTPTGGTSKARRGGSITATGNGSTGNAAASARDGSYFRPPPPIRQYQKTMDKTAKKAALLGGISASAAIEAVSSRHPGRLHRVWAHAGVIGPERGAVIGEWVDGDV